MKKKRHWRTRKDPLSEISDEIDEKLRENPFLSGTKLLREFQALYVGRFEDSLLRTFQRRAENWRKNNNSIDSNRYWLQELMQGKIELSELKNIYSNSISDKDIDLLNNYIINKPLKLRNKAVSILGHLKNIPTVHISDATRESRKAVKSVIDKYEAGGVEFALSTTRKIEKKYQDQKNIEEVFKILHEPPSLHGINRTSWKMDDIHRLMIERGKPIAISNIRKILWNSGYRVRKAKKVLTSTDPLYREKLQEITSILQNLKPSEKFFSIDEFGPFSVKVLGGRSLVARDELRTYPQWQKSKGTIIITAALELSTNQITHFYSDKKNTQEMIKLLDFLIEKYSSSECIYFSWDAASWHASKALYERVKEVNRHDFKKKHKTPSVKLAPLPSCAQFLNVIESVFSGMARAIIHNSNYSSVAECKSAIDRYYEERNLYYTRNPRKAGNKIWGKEVVAPVFRDSNNCKNPQWR